MQGSENIQGTSRGQSQQSRCEGKRGRSESDPSRMGKEDKELVLCVQSRRLKTEHKDKLGLTCPGLAQECFPFTVPSLT